MLSEFQQALVDLTASPELCIRARRNPAVLKEDYQLTEREWRRLVAIVTHKGMECACTVYRANRLAPLAMNIPRTCKSLGPDLRSVVSEFWAAYPESNVHFFIETKRFCCFLEAQIAEGRVFLPGVADVLAGESAVITAALEESYTEANGELSRRSASL